MNSCLLALRDVWFRVSEWNRCLIARYTALFSVPETRRRSFGAFVTGFLERSRLNSFHKRACRLDGLSRFEELFEGTASAAPRIGIENRLACTELVLATCFLVQFRQGFKEASLSFVSERNE